MRMHNGVVWIIVMFVSLQPCVVAENAKGGSVEIEDVLADVKLGTPVKALLAQHPNLYRHELRLGEVLYEACNQEQLEVFTFTEEPWSKGIVSYIWTLYADPSVCRDRTGSLPDLAMNPATPKGVRLGDPESHIVERYGPPLRRKTISAAETILEYQAPPGDAQSSVEKLKLFFTVKEGKVTEISLAGDMLGVKKPF